MRNIWSAKFVRLFFAASLLSAALPNLSSAKASISISPKIWFSGENFNAYSNSNFTDFIEIREQVNIPLAGAAVVVTPGDVPIDFLFNFYGGSGEGRFRQIQTAGNDVRGTFKAKRTDIEMLIRWRPKDKTVNFFTGLRVNAFTDTLTLVTPTNFTFNATGNKTFERTTTILLWEVGAGFYAPITENGMHRFFGNFTAGLGSYKSETTNAITGREGLVSGGAAGWDVNAGYEWVIGQHFSVMARYRAYAKPAGPLKDSYDLTVVQGPDFGATFRF